MSQPRKLTIAASQPADVSRVPITLVCRDQHGHETREAIHVTPEDHDALFGEPAVPLSFGHLDEP